MVFPWFSYGAPLFLGEIPIFLAEIHIFSHLSTSGWLLGEIVIRQVVPDSHGNDGLPQEL